MRYWVIGLGAIGRRHLANLRAQLPHAEIVAVSRSLSHEQARDLGASTRVEHLNVVLAQPADAAIIASPASDHLAQARACLEAGVPCLVEKPLAVHSAGVADLFSFARQRGLELQVGYNLRFSEGFAALRQHLAAGAIGELLGAEVSVGQYLPDWRPGRDYRDTVSAQKNLGGGVLRELSHELDYLTGLLGPAQAVQAHLRTTGALDLAVEDWADLWLRFAGGVSASVHLDFIARAPHRYCRLLGSDGTLVWDWLAGTVTWQRAGVDANVETQVQHTDEDRGGMYQRQLAHFLQSLSSERGSDQSTTDQAKSLAPASAENALHVLALIEACERAHSEGRWITV